MDQSNQQEARHSGNDDLMGNRPGQLNLRAARARASNVSSVLDEFVHLLRYAPASLTWNDVMDKMSVLNVQLYQLRDELRPVSHHYALHPKSVNSANSVTLPVMLATMLYPDQQLEYDDITRTGGTTDVGEYERWRGLVDGVSRDLNRNVRRRQARTGAEQSVAPLDDDEQELLNVVGFGGLR